MNVRWAEVTNNGDGLKFKFKNNPFELKEHCHIGSLLNRND